MNIIADLVDAIQNERTEQIATLLTQDPSYDDHEKSKINDEMRQLLLADDFANARCTEVNLLCHAASQGYYMLISWLLDHEAEPNYANLNDETFRTPLHFAVYENHTNIVELLLSAGAKPDAKGDMLETPLHTAAEGNEKIVLLLLKYAPDIDTEDIDFQTPLHKAVSARNENIISLLLDQGASINPQDEDGRTPLHHAVGQNHETVVSLLLERGANPNIPNDDYETPLYLAASQGNQKIVRLLLNAGAFVDSRCKSIEKSEPLHVAAKHGQTTVVEELLNHVANIHSHNQWAETPLYLALQEENLETAQLLLRKGAYSYKDEKTEKNLSIYWEDIRIDTDVEREFYKTLLLVGVRITPKDQALPEFLAQTQQVIDATIKKWLAPFSLSANPYQQAIPDIVRALPRLVQWAEAVQILKAKRENKYNEIVGSIRLDSNTERFKDSLLASRVVIMKLSESRVLLRELLDLVENSLIQQALAKTLRQCYPISHVVADHIAAKITEEPERCGLCYNALFSHSQSTAYKPFAAPSA